MSLKISIRSLISNLNLASVLQTGLSRWLAVGRWPFIIYQSIIILVWLGLNIYLVYRGATEPEFFHAWDPYPFILLNLVLSFQAAYTGPVVMMSQNRQAEKDRLMAEHDYRINIKAEEEIKVLMEHLVHQDAIMAEMMTRLETICLKSELVAKNGTEAEIRGI